MLVMIFLCFFNHHVWIVFESRLTFNYQLSISLNKLDIIVNKCMFYQNISYHSNMSHMFYINYYWHYKPINSADVPLSNKQTYILEDAAKNQSCDSICYLLLTVTVIRNLDYDCYCLNIVYLSSIKANVSTVWNITMWVYRTTTTLNSRQGCPLWVRIITYSLLRKLKHFKLHFCFRFQL